MANKIVLNVDSKIGAIQAEEDDDFLFKCFVDHPALTTVKDQSNSRMFLLGSTGIGKSAILRMIEHQEENVAFIELDEMAMNYLSNSDTLSFLKKIDVDLVFFFRFLWMQVLCIELIKLAENFELSSPNDQGFIQKFLYSATDESVEYKKFVEDNQNKFWNTLDQTIIEETEKFEKLAQAEFGGEVAKAKGRAAYSKNLSKEKKKYFQERAKKFVNPKMVVSLVKVINGLSQKMQGSQKKYYILIDKIDDHWVDPEIKNALIHSLFEATKKLRKIRNYKPIIAIRNDVYEKMNLEHPPSTAQLEKNEDFLVRISWTKDMLWQLVEKRINHLFKWKYSSDNLHFHDFFKKSYDNNKTNTWNYMVERTLLRPRDVIKFVNYAFAAADGKSEVSKTSFSTAEGNYSDDRYEAIDHEWKPVFPCAVLLMEILRKKPRYFLAAELTTTDLTEYFFDKLGVSDEYKKDSLWASVTDMVNGNTTLEPIELVQETLHRLHLMGVIGLKVDAESSWQWFHKSFKPVSQNSINIDTKVEIHPMLWRKLGNR